MTLATPSVKAVPLDALVSLWPVVSVPLPSDRLAVLYSTHAAVAAFLSFFLDPISFLFLFFSLFFCFFKDVIENWKNISDRREQ